jgi:hypothetical protein
MNMVYVIGYPGSGKTTAVARAITSPMIAEHVKPFKHIVYADGIVQLGANRAAFSGTDALPLNVQPAVLKWLPAAPEELIIAEGDRLGNDSFFRAVVNLGFALNIVLIDVTPLKAGYRTWLRGHDFDDRFWSGRITKVNNLKRRWNDRIHSIDGSQCMDDVASELQSIVYG